MTMPFAVASTNARQSNVHIVDLWSVFCTPNQNQMITSGEECRVVSTLYGLAFRVVDHAWSSASCLYRRSLYMAIWLGSHQPKRTTQHELRTPNTEIARACIITLNRHASSSDTLCTAHMLRHRATDRRAQTLCGPGDRDKIYASNMCRCRAEDHADHIKFPCFRSHCCTLAAYVGCAQYCANFNQYLNEAHWVYWIVLVPRDLMWTQHAELISDHTIYKEILCSNRIYQCVCVFVYRMDEVSYWQLIKLNILYMHVI